MKKLLIPTDFSTVTENALLVATEIARKTGAEVELLHIIDAPYELELSTNGAKIPYDQLNDVFVLKSIEVARKKMGDIMDDIRYVGVRFIPKIKIGNPYIHFTNQIVKEPADLIIIGTEGSNSFFKKFYSSTNAEKVATHANSMVLSIKEETKNFKIRNVVLATNFENDSPEFVAKLIELQNIFDFLIHIVYVNPLINHNYNMAKIEKLEKEFIKTHKIRYYEFHVVEDLTEYTGITDYAKKIDADIIAISTHQHKGIHCLGGISDDLVNYAEQPILTYKAG